MEVNLEGEGRMNENKTRAACSPRAEKERRERMEHALAMVEEASAPPPEDNPDADGTGRPTIEEVCAKVGEIAIGRDREIRLIAEYFLLWAERRALVLKGIDRDLLPALRFLFLVGPTASSKTLLIRLISKIMKYRYVAVSLAALSGEGWRGVGVSDVLREAADWQAKNPGKVQVIFFDEADKHRVMERRLDEATFNPATALLSVLNCDSDDGLYHGSASTPNGTFDFELNLDDVIFAFAGAFSGIEEQVLRPSLRRRAGCGYGALADPAAREAALLDDDSLRLALEPEHVVEWGILAELVGRASYVISMTALSEDVLRRIVNDSPHSLQNRNALLMPDGFDFRIDDSAALRMARRARESGLGARILDGLLQPVVAHIVSAVQSNEAIASALVTWDEAAGALACRFASVDGCALEVV